MRTSNSESREREPELPSGGAKARYIESSALIAAKIEGDRTAWEAIRGEGARFTSALTLAEFARRVVRAGNAGDLDDARVRRLMSWLRRFARRCAIVDINNELLARVMRPFPNEPVRTLDAIHLATIESREEDPSQVAVVTRDRRVADNARAMGYLVE